MYVFLLHLWQILVFFPARCCTEVIFFNILSLVFKVVSFTDLSFLSLKFPYHSIIHLQSPSSSVQLWWSSHHSHLHLQILSPYASWPLHSTAGIYTFLFHITIALFHCLYRITCWLKIFHKVTKRYFKITNFV